MVELRVAPAARGAETAGQFKTLKRVGAVRATQAFVAALDDAFAVFARDEADRVTRQWFAARRGAPPAAADLADLTLAYYENALRKFRPYYELDYRLGGEERTCRYQGGGAFARWLGRQPKIKTKTFRVVFATPSARVQIQIQTGKYADRSFLWVATTSGPLLERLVGATERALAAEGRRRPRRRSWNANVLVSGTTSLWVAAALALRLRPHPWPTVLTAALLADVVLAFGLIYLFRAAWPPVELALTPARAGARAAAFLRRVGYVAAVAALTLTGAHLILSSFFKIVW